MCAAEPAPAATHGAPSRARPLTADVALALLALAVGLVVEMARLLRMNGGVFTYTLDDPYIHLAMAERIRHGFYGINPGEPAAPCSSILWPFLLVPFANMAVATYVPFVLGVLAAAGTVVIYVRFLASVLGSRYGRPGLAAWGAVLLMFATNLVGLPFSGMEHSLQVFLTVSLLYGLIGEGETGRVPRWLVPVIALGPLVRYENVALSGAAAVSLFARGHRGTAIRAAVITVLPLLLFSAFLIHLGLDPLPTSVLHKSRAFSASSPMPGVVASWQTTLRDPTGVLLLVAALAMAAIALRRERDRAERALAGAVTFAIAAHASGGGYGAYHRWEMYIVAATLITVLWLERRPIRAFADRASPVLVGAMAAAWCLVLAGRYVFGLSTVPLAANNIFEQQYQMHRFVTQFERRPVAANDIGWVSYGNPNAVLDVVGLGSEGFVSDDGAAVRVEALQRAVENRRVEVAMLYDEWVPVLPPGWRRMGELRLSRPKITPAFQTVAFYATGVGSYGDALRRWQSFRATLPPRVASMSGTDSTRAE